MKRITTLGLLLWIGFYAMGQTDTTKQKVWTEDYTYAKDTVVHVTPIIQSVETVELDLRQLIKAPYGTVWVNPLEDMFGKIKNIPDSVSMDLSGVSKFYFDNSNTEELSKSPWKEAVIKGYYMPSTAKLNEALHPFFIKQWEVTNAEYREFLSEMSSKPGDALYPDTLCWIKDFEGAYNDPMTRFYYYHPKYDNYPVVGVNFYQATAFCEWYEKRLNEAIELEGFQIEVDLPNQMEWALVNSKNYGYWMKQSNPIYEISDGFFDRDYFTQLELDIDTGRPKLTAYAMLPGYNSNKLHNFMNDGYLYTTPGRSPKEIRKQPMKDEVDNVFFLNTNVSEWMSESYEDNWKDLYEWRQTTLRNMATTDAVLLADLEKYYNANNDTVSGQLVRGGNWFYEHHAYRNDVNVGTHSAKVFINPNEAHSTLGFRFVIRVIPVSESAEN